MSLDNTFSVEMSFLLPHKMHKCTLSAIDLLEMSIKFDISDML
jgi:hypothetical protein